MFGYYKNKLNKLVNSDRYKKSGYVIQLLNGKYYVLKYKSQDRYVDLKHNYYSWDNNIIHFRDCLGNIRSVLKAFNYKVPIIKEIKNSITF